MFLIALGFEFYSRRLLLQSFPFSRRCCGKIYAYQHGNFSFPSCNILSILHKKYSFDCWFRAFAVLPFEGGAWNKCSIIFGFFFVFGSNIAKLWRRNILQTLIGNTLRSQKQNKCGTEKHKILWISHIKRTVLPSSLRQFSHAAVERNVCEKWGGMRLYFNYVERGRTGGRWGWSVIKGNGRNTMT